MGLWGNLGKGKALLGNVLHVFSPPVSVLACCSTSRT